ncbi:hypothetical protein QAD02_020444 [Eretmocerus hayati]|uniref:Uncharacterized protein n=1 Tax=Eretmocerus hayati TaxID=131215 RepID=A0ACC2PME9_9HYME|nr:hypothetical protein QAD02_020444 [Eretmocerus hayati]
MKWCSISNADSASTSKNIKIEDDEYDFEESHSESSFYEDSTVSKKDLTRYLVTLEDDSESTVTLGLDSSQYSSSEEFKDMLKDDSRSSNEIEELQHFSSVSESDTSDDETSSESTAANIRYLIELNEQGLIVNFDINDSNRREESTQGDPPNLECEIEHSPGNMTNILSRLPRQSLRKITAEVYNNDCDTLQKLLSVGATYSFKQFSVTASTPKEDIFKYDLILNSKSVIEEIANEELAALESQYDLTKYAKILLKSAGELVGR